MQTLNRPADTERYRPYQVSGPRYTSYPSANHFHNGFGATDWREAALASNEEPIPAPLSVYVHVPFCSSPCFFCACNRIITRDPAMSDHYRVQLRREIALQAQLFDHDRRVKQIHFGGGTPTQLGCAGMAEVMHELEEHFQFAKASEREFGIEVDPRQTDKDMLEFLYGIGFNRISLGIQDFDPIVQQAVNRVQSEQATLELLDGARETGFTAINVDLICGLPHQTIEGFGRTLERVIKHRPDRIAMYSYAHMPEMFKAQRQIKSETLPDLEGKLALLHLADERLLEAGYIMIGLDHYALPDDPLAAALREGTLQRNFQGYSTHANSDLIGLGVSAIGTIGDCYAQNSRNLVGYNAALDAGCLPVVRGFRLSADDRLRKEIIHTLMCTNEVRYEPLEARYGMEFSNYFADELERLQQLEQDGLVEISGQGFRLLPQGRPVMRVAAMVFDAYLAGAPNPHSSTI